MVVHCGWAPIEKKTITDFIILVAVGFGVLAAELVIVLQSPCVPSLERVAVGVDAHGLLHWFFAFLCALSDKITKVCVWHCVGCFSSPSFPR